MKRLKFSPKHLHDLEARALLWGGPSIVRNAKDFRPYQVWMAKRAYEQDCLLGAEMGLGKTAATLYALKRLLEDRKVTRVLIIAPLRVAENTWPDEIAGWSFAHGFNYAVVTGNPQQRAAALALKTQIVVTNPANVRWLFQQLPGRSFDFDCLVYDESTRLGTGKERTTPTVRADGTSTVRRRSEYGWLLSRRAKFKRVIELSGTPGSRGTIGLWGPIKLLDGGKRLGDSRNAFLDRWFTFDKYTYSYDPIPGSQEQITDRVKDVFFSLSADDYLDLPSRVGVDHWISMSCPVKEKYERMKRQMLEEFVRKDGSTALVEAVNGGVLTQKLLQLANGGVYFEDGTAGHVHDEKIELLRSIVQEAEGRPILLAYSFKFDAERIAKAFKQARFFGDTPNDMRDWNAGRVPLLCMHPASAGHGLNFQAGGNIDVCYGLPWSLELYRQFRARLRRSGQTQDRVFSHRIMTRGTVENKVVLALNDKGSTEDSIKKAVKAYIGDTV